LPAELAWRESRLAKIRAAKAELEAEAQQKAEEKKAAAAEAQMEQRREQTARTGNKTSEPDPRRPDAEQAVPDPKAQRNFTDPESRIMPDGSHKGSFLQGHNTQIAVDRTAQVIVAAEVTQQSNDKQQLVPMLEQVKQNVGAQPQAAAEALKALRLKQQHALERLIDTQVERFFTVRALGEASQSQ
jgi:hypothetical protein